MLRNKRLNLLTRAAFVTMLTRNITKMDVCCYTPAQSIRNDAELRTYQRGKKAASKVRERKIGKPSGWS